MRKYGKGFFVIFFSIILSVSNTAQAETFDEWYTVVNPTNPPADVVPYWGLSANGIAGSDFSIPNLLSFGSDGLQPLVSKVTSVQSCNGPQDPKCPGNQYQRFNANLPFCSAEYVTDCIVSLETKGADEIYQPATYTQEFPTNSPLTFKGDPNIALPPGRAPALFSIPNAPHQGGSQYIVKVELNGDRLPPATKFRLDWASISIYAVKIIERKSTPPYVSLDPELYPSLGVQVGGGGSPDCVEYSSTQCALSYPLPVDINFRITIRLANKIDGWLHGRVSSADAEISKDSFGNQIVKLSANPIKIPAVYGWVEKSKAPKELQDFYSSLPDANRGSGVGCKNGNSGACESSQWVSTIRGLFFDESSLKEFLLWLPIVNDTAKVAPTRWMFRTMDSGEWSRCTSSTDGLSGLVTTNATQYIGGPPKYDPLSGDLNYKVAAPHFLPNASIFKGNYDLIIKSEVARCLYGFSNSPVKASISVISSDGTAEVATTSAIEKDGWFKFNAKGFSFSSPTLRVQLTQQKPESVPIITSPAPIKNSSSITSKKSQRTIRCQRGSTIRKVTALAPKCPKGYKQIT
jgi:hypothetical protein